jgi:hypothetical protein
VIFLQTRRHGIFRVNWWSSNELLATGLFRAPLARYADSRLRIPRFRLRANTMRAGAAFLSAPEVKQ